MKEGAMYGTVARLRLKAGAEEQLRAIQAGYQANPVPGMVATYAYRMDADPQEYFLAVLFDSREAYHANAQSPAQAARFAQMLALLEGEPEWHDGEIVND
jgi:quinol monooxygenase YgiN